MSSNKESKSAAKGQKKIQKTNKKQKQQEQQQSTVNNNNNNINIKNVIANSSTHAKTKQGDPKNNRNINNNSINNNNNCNDNNNYNNNNNNNNNNDNMIQNNNGSTSANPPSISQKLKEQYQAERRAQLMTTPEKSSVESLPKMERTSSFRGKLSRIINHLTGSKENLARTDELKDEAGKTPFTFTRSRSMIMLRRPNRRSFIEPQLEQLSEEAEKSGDPMSPASPRKNSLADSSAADSASPVFRRRADTVNSTKTPTRRQSAVPITSTPLEQTPGSGSSMSRKPSLVSLTPSDPQLNFQKRRSSTLIASFKSTFSGLTGSSSTGGSSASSSDKKKDKMNPKWSASLQSLQAIDNMVSYANMSFIDYDKFNGYEKQLERQQSLMSLGEQQTPVMHPLQLPSTATAEAGAANSHWHSSTRLADSPTPSPSVASFHLHTSHTPSSSQDSTARTVVMRRKNSKSSSLLRQTSASSRNSMHSNYNLDTDVERNLDMVHNVYRESLDSRTLNLLNQSSRNSFVLDQAMFIEALNLEDGSANRRCERCSQRVSRVNSFKQREDVVDGCAVPKKQVS